MSVLCWVEKANTVIRLYLHCKRKHNNQHCFVLGASIPVIKDNQEELEYDNYAQLISNIEDNNSTETINDNHDRMAAAKYALTSEADHKLSRSATDEVLIMANKFIQEYRSLYLESVKKAMHEGGLPTNMLNSLPTNTFLDEMSTTKKRDKFYLQELGLVELEEVQSTTKFGNVNGRLMGKKSFGYYVPLQTNLQNLLSMPEVRKYVENPHFSQTYLRKDVRDGSYVRNNPLSKRNPKALQIALTDDLEVACPLGSHI